MISLNQWGSMMPGNTFEITTVLQAFYLTASVSILLVYLTPALSKRFLAYGARDVSVTRIAKERPRPTPARRQEATVIDGILDRMADLKVPHRWFVHFYVVSIASSAFWAYQFVTQGRFYTFFASFAPRARDSTGSIRPVCCWLLLAMQGVRRLYECLKQPHGASKMWIGHYAIGLAFYLATGIAIWVEGLPDLKASHELNGDICDEISIPAVLSTLKSDSMFYALFGAASLTQNKIHSHLMSLKKYTLPTQDSFKRLIAPHYTCECILYLSLAFLSSPPGCYLNQTMTAALIFVVVNLGISADETKKWTETKFGSDSVAGKWRMIPLLW